MALHYQYKGSLDLKKATEAQLSLYNALIWGSLGVCMDRITETNYEEFTFRFNFAQMATRSVSNEEVKLFIGLSTNVSSLTRKQWEKRQKKILYDRRLNEMRANAPTEELNK